MTVRIAALASRHISRVVEIEKASQSCPWSEQSFSNEIEAEQSIFIVAEVGTDVVGFAGQWLVVDEAHIITVAVDESHRRKGIARRLINELLSRALDSGATCATLEVRVSNAAAIALYESMGFQAAGHRKRYYPDNKEDAVVMWLYNLQDWADPA